MKILPPSRGIAAFGIEWTRSIGRDWARHQKINKNRSVVALVEQTIAVRLGRYTFGTGFSLFYTFSRKTLFTRNYATCIELSITRFWIDCKKK